MTEQQVIQQGQGRPKGLYNKKNNYIAYMSNKELNNLKLS